MPALREEKLLLPRLLPLEGDPAGAEKRAGEDLSASEEKMIRTRNWHGYEVDFDLENSWLERLNRLFPINGTCTGHPEKSGSLMLGLYTDKHPHFSFEVGGGRTNFEKYLKIAMGTAGALSQSPNTKIFIDIETGPGRDDTTYTIDPSGPYLWVNFQRKRALTMEGLSKITKHAESSDSLVSISVYCTIRNTGKNKDILANWWERTIACAEPHPNRPRRR